jgi:hypothetical protein
MLALIYSTVVTGVMDDTLVDSFEDFKKIYETVSSILDETEKQPVISESELSFLEIEKAGFLKEFIWEAFARPYWSEPENLKMDDFIIWYKKQGDKTITPRPIGANVLLDIEKK